MRSLSSIFSFRKADPVAGIALFAVAVIVIEAGLSVTLPDNHMVRRLQYMMRQAEEEPAPDLQLMGDSVARSGLAVPVFQQWLGEGRTVRRDAIGGSGPEFSWFYLKRQVAAGNKPGAILYAPSPHTLSTTRTSVQIAAGATPSEIREMAAAEFAPSELAYALLCRCSYSLRFRELIRDALLGNTKALEEFTKPVDVSQELTSRAAPLKAADEIRWPRETLPTAQRAPYVLTRGNRRYIENILGLCRDEGIPVYWAVMTVPRSVADTRNDLGYMAAFQADIADWEQRFGLRVIERDALVYREDEFTDHLHMTREGAHRFSRHLTERMDDLGITPGNLGKR